MLRCIRAACRAIASPFSRLGHSARFGWRRWATTARPYRRSGARRTFTRRRRRSASLPSSSPSSSSRAPCCTLWRTRLPALPRRTSTCACRCRRSSTKSSTSAASPSSSLSSPGLDGRAGTECGAWEGEGEEARRREDGGDRPRGRGVFSPLTPFPAQHLWPGRCQGGL